MKRLVQLLPLIALMLSCDPYGWHEKTSIKVNNFSGNDIMFTSPIDVYEPLNVEISDTVMMYYYRNAWVSTVLKKSSKLIHCRLDSFEEWIPEGSSHYSLFILDSQLLSDHSYLNLFQNDLYLQRYDLTHNDIISLCNEDGVLVISYPPDERMKDINMWPPYALAIKNAKEY